MGNFFELLKQYNDFKQMIEKSGKNPSAMLEEEIRKRNLSQNQIEQLKQSAQVLSQILGVK